MNLAVVAVHGRGWAIADKSLVVVQTELVHNLA